MQELYLTLAEADDIFNSIYPKGCTCDTLWDSLDIEGKIRLLSSAQTTLENGFLFVGRKARRDQELQFPRVYKCQYYEVPKAYLIAIVQQAGLTLQEQNSEYKQMQSNGVKQYSVEGSSITFGDSASAALYEKDSKGIYKEIIHYLNQWVY